jgi:hypothetical protein
VWIFRKIQRGLTRNVSTLVIFITLLLSEIRGQRSKVRSRGMQMQVT